MSSTACRIVLASCWLATIVLPRVAVGQLGDGFSGASEPVTLITYKRAQEALKLTDEQKHSAKQINQEFREELKRIYARELPEEQLLRTSQRTINRANARSAEFLKPEQRERLKQISLQIREDVIRYTLLDVTLFDEDLQKELKISDVQASKLEEADVDNDRARKEVAQKMKALRFTSKQAQQDYVLEQFGKAALERLIDVLTPEQMKAYKQLKGAKFEYSRDDLYG
jgi:hypothetical protein